MSQDVFETIDPSISGTTLATILNNFKAALMSGLSGTSRPTELDQGGGWIDTTNDPTEWSFKIWTGTTDVEVFKVNLSTNIASVALAVEQFSVKRVAADTTGSILKLVKQRIANSGQVLDGDTVGEIQFVGRGDDASNPVVAKIIYEASDDMTSSAFGGELSIHSTPDGSATLTKHLRFIDGIVEAIVPLKVNSLQPATQEVATEASINQLNGDKTVVEMTGSTATDLRGIDSSGQSKIVTVHNKSSASITVKHENSSAAAADRFKLPSSLDYIITPDSSATFIYVSTESRWKLQSTSEKNFSGFTVETFYGPNNVWAAPASTTSARIRAYKKQAGLTNETCNLITNFGAAYAWGLNANGQVGDNSVTPKSSPVAVSGGINFLRTWGSTGSDGASRYGLANNGSLYAWGINSSGQLGDSSTTPRSTPVAVSGGIKFLWMYAREKSAWGISTGNKMYAWGENTNGQLGLGDVSDRNVPQTSVLNSLRWAKLIPISGGTNNSAVVGITTAGVVYGWGINTNGNLGVGDTTPRSVPTAVVGGVSFSDIVGGAVSGRYFYVGLNTSGAAYAWGDNSSGQLGTDDTTPRSSPVAVVGGNVFKQIFAHEKSESVFALNSSGALFAWGTNDQGQLGVGDTTNRSSPVAVLGGLTIKKVIPYKKSVFAITPDGDVYAWGLNANGQLANGDVVSRSSPVAVLGGFKFSDIKVVDAVNDDYSIFGVQADGTTYAWGKNDNGSLGLGDVTPRSSPVAVVGAVYPDVGENPVSAYLTVTPSANYTVSVTDGISSFGNVPMGAGVYKIEVEYLQ